MDVQLRLRRTLAGGKLKKSRRQNTDDEDDDNDTEEAKKNVFVVAAWEGIYILGCRLASQRERDALLMVFLTRTATPHRVFLACSAPKQRISAPKEVRKGGQRNRKTCMFVLQANRRKKRKNKKKGCQVVEPRWKSREREGVSLGPYTVRVCTPLCLSPLFPRFVPFFFIFHMADLRAGALKRTHEMKRMRSRETFQTKINSPFPRNFMCRELRRKKR